MNPSGIWFGEFFPIQTYGRAVCGGNLITDCCAYRLSHQDIESAKRNCPHFQQIQLSNLDLSQIAGLYQQSSAASPVTCVSFITPKSTVTFVHSSSGLAVVQSSSSTATTTVGSLLKPVCSISTPHDNTTPPAKDLLGSLLQSYAIGPTPADSNNNNIIASFNDNTAAPLGSVAASFNDNTAAPLSSVTASFSNTAAPLSSVAASFIDTATPLSSVAASFIDTAAPIISTAAESLTNNAGIVIDDIFTNNNVDSSFDEAELSNLLSPPSLEQLEQILKTNNRDETDLDGGVGDVGGNDGGGDSCVGGSSALNSQGLDFQNYPPNQPASKALTTEINIDNVDPQLPINFSLTESETNVDSLQLPVEQQPSDDSQQKRGRRRCRSPPASRVKPRDQPQESITHYVPMTENISDDESRDSFYSSFRSLTKKLPSKGLVPYVDSEDSNETTSSTKYDDPTEAYMTEQLYYSYDGKLLNH